MVKCPKCGEDLADDTNFCTNCQKKLFSECPKCHKRLNLDAKFCSECGTNLEEGAEEKKNITCKNCGAAIAPNDKFCEKCGVPVIDGKAVLPTVLDVYRSLDGLVHTVRGKSNQDNDNTIQDIFGNRNKKKDMSQGFGSVFKRILGENND